jgi:uncharacterized coiled-coil protein SlyX
MSDSLSERVTVLEERLMHQEQVIATLDGVVREFTERVAKLQQTVADLRKSGEAALEARSDAPPHY